MIPESEIIFSRISDKNAVLIVGLMAIIRQLPVYSDKSVNDLFHSALGIMRPISKFHQLLVV